MIPPSFESQVLSAWRGIVFPIVPVMEEQLRVPELTLPNEALLMTKVKG